MTDTASTRLAACPCGALPAHGYMCAYDDEEGYGYVECHEGSLSVVVHAATEAEAIAAWNERSTPPSQDKGEALTDDVERVALAAADAAIDAIRVGFPGWRPSDAQLGFGRAVGKRAYLAALSTAQASEREQIAALAIEDAVAKHGSIVIEPMGDGLGWAATDTDSEDRVWHPLSVARSEPSPVDVERVALLALLQHQRAKVPDTQQSRHSVKGLDAAIAALQSPPVEQPAQAEARAALSTKEEGLVEELATLDVFLAAYTHHPDGEVLASAIDPTDDLLTLGQLRRILAALKARTSPETVELLREAREFLRQVSNALACSEENDPLEPIADNGMTVWDGMRAEHKRLWPRSITLLTRINTHLSNTPDQGSDQHG